MSWWFQPIWKTLVKYSQIGSFPQFQGWKIQKYLKPAPSLSVPPKRKKLPRWLVVTVDFDLLSSPPNSWGTSHTLQSPVVWDYKLENATFPQKHKLGMEKLKVFHGNTQFPMQLSYPTEL